MTKEDYSLPQLPPLEDVLKLVNKGKKDEIDYKQAYNSLSEEVKRLTEKLEKMQGTPQSSQLEKNIDECPILKGQNGSGEIRIIRPNGIKRVVCQYYTNSNSVRCKLTGQTCSYGIN